MSEFKSATMDSNIAVDMSESLKITPQTVRSKEAKSVYDDKPVFDLVKALFDFCASLIALIILSPVLFYIFWGRAKYLTSFSTKSNPS